MSKSIVCGKSGNNPLWTNCIEHGCNDLRFLIPYQPVAPVALYLQDVGAKINCLVDLVKIIAFLPF